MDINTELESGFEIHMDKMRKITDTFPSFAVTTSKLTRELPLPQSAWLLLDRQGGGGGNILGRKAKCSYWCFGLLGLSSTW